MKKIMKLFGIIAFVAVIGFSMIACDNGGNANSLDGVWVSQMAVISVDGSVGTISSTQNLSPLWASAVSKGYLQPGTQFFRYLRKTDNYTWTGEVLVITSTTSTSNVASGPSWYSCTISMNSNGRNFTCNYSYRGNQSVPYTRQR